MRSRNKVLAAILILLSASCVTKPQEKVLPFSEQIKVDTVRAQGLYQAFHKEVTFKSSPKTEHYLTLIATKLAKEDTELRIDAVKVRVHDDSSNPDLAHFFAFPGTTISVPYSFLKKIRFENELAAALAFELANVMKRTLANHVEKLEAGTPILFGQGSVFDLEFDQRKESMQLGVKLLYYGGYDTRGMPSIFEHYPQYYGAGGASGLDKKEVNFNIREAQKAKSDYLPSMKPVVRSDEFIEFKKELQ